jgi:ATP-dependent Lon protease
MNQNLTIATLPVLPSKGTVVFPDTMIPITLGANSSKAALEAAMNTPEKSILITAQRNSSNETTNLNDLCQIGTKTIITHMHHTTGGGLQVWVQGIERMMLLGLEQTEPYFLARSQQNPLQIESSPEVEALHRALVDLSSRIPNIVPSDQIPKGLDDLQKAQDPLTMTYKLTSLLNLNVEGLQALLEVPTQLDFMKEVYAALSHEFQIRTLQKEIESQAREKIKTFQRKFFLRQQLEEIRHELGETVEEPANDCVQVLKKRLHEATFPDEIKQETLRDANRLAQLPPISPEHQVLRSYLDFVLELPWNVLHTNDLEIANVRKILDRDHYGLHEVKERILEYLAVMKMNPNSKAPILCFVGPPGVGKTSIGQSIARALGRPFEKMSLGGLHDEAILRGHRRTYVGAMPGRILQALRRAGSRNPIIMLDEIDKVGEDFRGDPSAALLEILDPTHNHSFRDNYLDMPFDLSKVMFIMTANTMETMPSPLLDRIECIQMPGYSLKEKQEIATRYLWPSQLAGAGLSERDIRLEEGTLHHIITNFTREAGVRQLDQMCGRLTRKAALNLTEKTQQATNGPIDISPEALIHWLGTESYIPEEHRQTLSVGVATGLAWTETGGDLLYVESTLLPGGSDLMLTGQLGEVMQESAQAARSFLWSRAQQMGLPKSLFKKNGIHIHIPEGATPKDGPSAGVTMVTSLASTFLGIKVRPDTAMTGEVSLSGAVLSVGGIKEKILAAHRAGLTRIVLPRANEKDLQEIPEEVRQDLTFILTDSLDEVLSHTLMASPIQTIDSSSDD